MSSHQVILQLQEMMLRAVLLGQPLPGANQPLRLPDLEFVTRHPYIYLLDPVLLNDSPKPLRIVSLETLRQEAQEMGNIVYLQFHVGEVSDSSVNLRLEARIATGDANQHELGLSSVSVKFSKVGDEWQMVEPPISSAA